MESMTYTYRIHPEQNALTVAKKQIPELKAVHSQVLQDALKRLDKAFKMRQERLECQDT